MIKKEIATKKKKRKEKKIKIKAKRPPPPPPPPPPYQNEIDKQAKKQANNSKQPNQSDVNKKKKKKKKGKIQQNKPQPIFANDQRRWCDYLSLIGPTDRSLGFISLSSAGNKMGMSPIKLVDQGHFLKYFLAARQL